MGKEEAGGLVDKTNICFRATLHRCPGAKGPTGPASAFGGSPPGVLLPAPAAAWSLRVSVIGIRPPLGAQIYPKSVSKGTGVAIENGLTNERHLRYKHLTL